MYVHPSRWARGVLLCGMAIVVMLAGCATATPGSAFVQEAATPAPTTVPAVTKVPVATPIPATETPMPTPSPPPAPTSTSMPEAICAPLPLEGPGDPASDTDPGVYTVIGLAEPEGLNMHSCPDTLAPVLRALAPHRAGLRRVGQDREDEGIRWSPVSAGDVAGWVQAGYLAYQFGEADPALARRAGQIVQGLRDRDWAVVADAVHPDQGVRFSPYTFVRVGMGEDADLVFSAEQLAGLADDGTVYRWGVFDGIGEPIDKTFSEYYDRFVYDVDFSRPAAVGFDEVVGSGNTINNVAEVYPLARVVEYHLPGTDPRFGGMDWRSLRLVLEPVGDNWYLVGVVHDEWTI